MGDEPSVAGYSVWKSMYSSHSYHSHFRCCCSHPKDDFAADDDNCCRCNLVALKKISGLPNADFVYATFHSAVSSRLRSDSNKLSQVFGLDMEGTCLVGNVGLYNNGSSGGKFVNESGVFLGSSLSFQEEMDSRCLRDQSNGGGSQRTERDGGDHPSCMSCVLCARNRAQRERGRGRYSSTTSSNAAPASAGRYYYGPPHSRTSSKVNNSEQSLDPNLRRVGFRLISNHSQMRCHYFLFFI